MNVQPKEAKMLEEIRGELMVGIVSIVAKIANIDFSRGGHVCGFFSG